MPALEDLQLKQNELIRKMTAASMFIAAEGTDLPTALTAGTSEVQTVTVTGAPTGGTFTLTYSGATTAAIAYNAAATAVQTALEALSNLVPGDVTCGGGPLPATPVTVTFNGLGNVAQMTATGAFTGGTTPAVAVTTTTPGIEIAPVALPAGYVDLGYVSKDDGYSFGNETEMNEVTSHGVSDPTRRDIISTTSTVGFTAQETKRRVLELMHNVDLSAVVPDPATGEVAFNKPLAPATRYYRSLFLGRDGIGLSAIYMAVIYPRAMISETGEQSASDESEFGYPLTLTATPDSSVGYSVRMIWGGPGWKRMLARMGF